MFAVDLSGSSFDHQRFDWEARVAQLVSGRPNLPEVLASGLTENGQPYLVSKLYERGRCCDGCSAAARLSPGEVASVGRQLAMALETLHQNSILHGDVSRRTSSSTTTAPSCWGTWARRGCGPTVARRPR